MRTIRLILQQKKYFQFKDNGLWWKGPSFFNEDGNGNWSVELEINKTDDVIKKELKHAAKVLTNSVQVTPVQTKVGGLDDRNLKNLIDITRYSSFDKLLVITSYV